jgi:hypothetical protein
MYDYIIYEKSRIPFLCGLDLGQRQDYTALVLLERVDSFGEFEPITWTRPVLSTLHVRYIHRFPLNTSATLASSSTQTSSSTLPVSEHPSSICYAKSAPAAAYIPW